jgi:hypothetical protein
VDRLSGFQIKLNYSQQLPSTNLIVLSAKEPKNKRKKEIEGIFFSFLA